ncbi:exo-alpha-sialidase [Candidatus Poribacteria bacterium]
MRKIAVLITVIAATTLGAGSGSIEDVDREEARMLVNRPLADDFVKVFESPNPENIYCYSPGIARCPSGRIIATLDLGGPGIQELPGPKGLRRSFKNTVQGKVFTSDDHGKTWVHRVDFPFMHARPFMAGGSLYVLGQCDDLMVIRSDDEGESWSSPITLTQGERWAQAPCNVHYANGCVYLVMEKRAYTDVKGWPVSVNAPVLMRGKIGDDLTRLESWAFASEMVFRDVIPAEALDYFGVPFYEVHPKDGGAVAPGRYCAPIGWLETNVVQFVDPDYYWYDPDGKTFHLWSRAHTGGTGFAAIAKVVENDDGSMTTMLETVPSGRKAVFVPCPGGQMRFHILYDEVTKLYWLLGSQATDSMTRAEKLPEERYNLPNNERHRLQLHFSKNCIDWCFAGIVAIGASPKQSRHYASMVIDGDDLHVLSRSGDSRAKNPHDGNLISFHTVRNFRRLVY